MISRNMHTEILLFEDCVMTAFKWALETRFFVGMCDFFVHIEGIFLHKRHVTIRALVWPRALVLLHVIMHRVLVLFHCTTDSADIVTVVVFDIFKCHCL